MFSKVGNKNGVLLDSAGFRLQLFFLWNGLISRQTFKFIAFLLIRSEYFLFYFFVLNVWIADPLQPLFIYLFLKGIFFEYLHLSVSQDKNYDIKNTFSKEKGIRGKDELNFAFAALFSFKFILSKRKWVHKPKERKRKIFTYISGIMKFTPGDKIKLCLTIFLQIFRKQTIYLCDDDIYVCLCL